MSRPATRAVPEQLDEAARERRERGARGGSWISVTLLCTGSSEIVADIPSEVTRNRWRYFGSDLWEALEQECGRLGVSVAQYLREAALTRLVYAAGTRGDDEFAEERAHGESSEAAALAAQSRLVRQRAREVREIAAKRRLG